MQSVLSFAVAVLAATVSVVSPPVDGWVRGFLGLGALYAVTSALAPAECVRDR